MSKKIVLAYSGGLDTSVILKWLQETYRCEVVTFTADLGQGEELEQAEAGYFAAPGTLWVKVPPGKQNLNVDAAALN